MLFLIQPTSYFILNKYKYKKIKFYHMSDYLSPFIRAAANNHFHY